MTLAPGTKLGPYEILALIGTGGMGEVWKARDTRLGRMVAIKTVKEQHSERFKQEARSIAALNHPNICQLFDIGPDYLVLEYVEGKPLLGPLPEKEAVRLAIQIAAALEEAHRNGIIHRDLKPSNIMVTYKNSVKLLDFGLAKLYEQDAGSAGLPGVALAKLGVLPAISTSPTADYPATQAGAVLGTVAYMSPEQAQGQPADARSDIFSFGLVLYEMLSGRRAFSGDNLLAVLSAIQKSEPLTLELSPSLQVIVRRCLAKQTLERYQTAAEARAALEQAFTEIAAKTSVEPQPSIAVLPFIDMSPGKDNEWFGDGLAEEIINALTQIPGLKVIARTSAFAFKGKQEDIIKIAEALRVRTILEGSVRKAGNRIRITAQLITAADGSHLWSERYDRDMTDVFAIQDEISQSIAEKLRVRLSGHRTMVKHQTDNMEAYNLYLIGRYHFFRNVPEELAKSKEYFERAIELDPNYALAWFGLAHLYNYLGAGRMRPKLANAQCRQAALKALELDEMLPQAHAIIAVLQANEYRWKEAELAFRRALELGPESGDIFQLYSFFYLVPMRRFDEAIKWMRKAIELDPLSPHWQISVAGIYAATGQFDLAVEHSRKALELNPNYPIAQMYLGVFQILMGKLDEGIRACEMAALLLGRYPLSLASLCFAYASAGRTSEARKLVEELRGLAEKTYVPNICLAWVCLTLGEIEKGLDWTEKAVDECEPTILFFLNLFAFDPVRSHPRYHALLRKMNLAK